MSILASNRNRSQWCGFIDSFPGGLSVSKSSLDVVSNFEVYLAQVDLMGDLNGFLAAHPLTPIVSLHHIEAIFPLFPGTTRAQGLKRLTKAIRVDPHNILQQSICYDPKKEWSFSVSWGYLVHVYKGFIPPHELEVPQLTFMSWHKRRESYAFPMNTRPRPREICDEPANFFMVDAKKLNDSLSYSAYVKVERPNRVRSCQEKLMPISLVDKIFIENEPIGNEWFQVKHTTFYTIPGHCCDFANLVILWAS